jgi:uncharacterized RDD family membrane protein YckC
MRTGQHQRMDCSQEKVPKLIADDILQCLLNARHELIDNHFIACERNLLKQKDIIMPLYMMHHLAAIAIPIWFFFYYDDDMTAAKAYQNVQPLHYIISSLAFFGYWTYFEFTSGQSIGKRLLKIKTIDLSGDNRIDIKSAAIESFGKAFLLPIDVILGWIFTNNKRQRIFNRISNTIVIKLKKPQHIPEDNIRYTKD